MVFFALFFFFLKELRFTGTPDTDVSMPPFRPSAEGEDDDFCPRVGLPEDDRVDDEAEDDEVEEEQQLSSTSW